MTEGLTFADGFREGYRAVKGNTVALPAIPAQPALHAGKTAFQVGLLKGIEMAKR